MIYLSTYGSDNLNREPDFEETISGQGFKRVLNKDSESYVFTRKDETTLQFDTPIKQIDDKGNLVLPKWHGPDGVVDVIKLTMSMDIHRNEYNDGCAGRALTFADLDLTPPDVTVSWWLAPKRP